MKNIFDGWFKNLTALYESHRPKDNAYHNSQINRACLAHSALIIDPKSHILGPCQYLFLLIYCPFLFLKKHPRPIYSAENTDPYASLKRLCNYIYYY